MFLGTFSPKLDEKGRIILPAKFFDELASGVVITRGQERCLFLFSNREFENLYGKLAQAPLSNKEARDYARGFLAAANQELPDKQRRVTIPPILRQYAGLDRELTVIGVGSRLEIWDTATWEKYYSDVEEGFANTSGEVIPGLF